MALPLVPLLLGAGVIGTIVVLNKRDQAVVPGLAPAPSFATSPPAPAAIPAAGAPPGAPIITQAQFTALPADQQAQIKQDALNGILTLTSTQGTLFVDKNPTAPPATFIGVFKTGDLNGVPRLKITVDAVIGKQFGLDFSPVTSGNVILQTTDNDNGTAIPAVSVDPRFPGKTFLVPLNAINGAGDI